MTKQLVRSSSSLISINCQRAYAMVFPLLHILHSTKTLEKMGCSDAYLRKIMLTGKVEDIIKMH